MTIHGGPSFVQWQRMKLGPDVARDTRNMQHYMQYLATPAIVAWVDGVRYLVRTLRPLVERMLEDGALLAPSPVTAEAMDDSLERTMLLTFGFPIAAPARALKFPLANPNA